MANRRHWGGKPGLVFLGVLLVIGGAFDLVPHLPSFNPGSCSRAAGPESHIGLVAAEVAPAPDRLLARPSPGATPDPDGPNPKLTRVPDECSPLPTTLRVSLSWTVPGGVNVSITGADGYKNGDLPIRGGSASKNSWSPEGGELSAYSDQHFRLHVAPKQRGVKGTATCTVTPVTDQGVELKPITHTNNGGPGIADCPWPLPPK